MRRNLRVRTKKNQSPQSILEFRGFFVDVTLFLSAKLKKVKKKKKRGEGDFLDEGGRPYITKVFAKFSHDAPLPVVKKKHLTIEQLNARRRKVWLTIAKKEIPKVSVHEANETQWSNMNAQEVCVVVKCSVELNHNLNSPICAWFTDFQAEDFC